MAVIIQYIVERDGVQKMTFTDKKEADQYDKMLDIADSLYEFIGESDVVLDDEVKESLSLYLAQNSDTLTGLLKGSKPKTPKAKIKTNESKKASTSSDSLETNESDEIEQAVSNSENNEENNNTETVAA